MCKLIYATLQFRLQDNYYTLNINPLPKSTKPQMQNPINDKEIQKLIQSEEQRQSVGIELIASENYQSPAVLQVQASVFANKYAEGFP